MNEEVLKKRHSLKKSETFLPSIKEANENNRQRIRLALLGPNSMFGQEEILNKTKRKSKAVCVSSKVNLFYIQKEVFYCSFIKTNLNLI